MRLCHGAFMVFALFATSAQATGSMSFEAKGYLLDMVVGDASGPAIASISWARPGDQQATTLPMSQVVVEALDTRQGILLPRFRNPGDAKLPESFHLTGKDGVGTLRMGKTTLVGTFSWGT